MFRQYLAVLLVLFLLVDSILAKKAQGAKGGAGPQGPIGGAGPQGPPPTSKKFLTLSGMSNLRVLLIIVLCRLSSYF